MEEEPGAEAQEQPNVRRDVYDRFSVLVHWVTAFCVVVLLGLGWWMMVLIRNPATRAHAFPLFPIHKSIGILVLTLTAARILWGLVRKAPPFPSSLADWERKTAHAVQALFYLLLVIVPLSGWLYASTEWAESLDKQFLAPTKFFGLFTVPYMPTVAEAAQPARRFLSFHLSSVHAYLAYGLLAFVALHVCGALKHHFVSRDSVLGRMIPWLPARAGDEEIEAPEKPAAKTFKWLFAVALVVLLGTTGWMAREMPDTPASLTKVTR